METDEIELPGEESEASELFGIEDFMKVPEYKERLEKELSSAAYKFLQANKKQLKKEVWFAADYANGKFYELGRYNGKLVFWTLNPAGSGLEIIDGAIVEIDKKKILALPDERLVQWALPDLNFIEDTLKKGVNIDIINVLFELRKAVKDQIFLYDEEYYDILTLWIVYTYFYEYFDKASYLLFLAEKISGKTTALKMLQAFCRRAILYQSASEASFVRAIHTMKIVPLLDEATNDFLDKKNLLEILLCGITKGSVYMRVATDESDELRAWNVFGPKAFASPEPHTDHLASREIVIRMCLGTPPRLMTEKEKSEIRSLLYYLYVRQKVFGDVLQELKEIEDAGEMGVWRVVNGIIENYKGVFRDFFNNEENKNWDSKGGDWDTSKVNLSQKIRGEKTDGQIYNNKLNNNILINNINNYNNENNNINPPGHLGEGGQVSLCPCSPVYLSHYLSHRHTSPMEKIDLNLPKCPIDIRRQCENDELEQNRTTAPNFYLVNLLLCRNPRVRDIFSSVFVISVLIAKKAFLPGEELKVSGKYKDMFLDMETILNILKSLRMIASSLEEEILIANMSSIDALILEAYCRLNGNCSTTEIIDFIANEMGIKAQFSQRRIGMRLKTLGFIQKKSGAKRFWVIKKDRLLKQLFVYGLSKELALGVPEYYEDTVVNQKLNTTDASDSTKSENSP